MIEYIGGRVWPEIERYRLSSTGTLAAVAYVGRAATEMMPLRSGDSIVVDGSDQSLINGTVDPAVVRAWRRHGARVYSLGGLHAKVIVFNRGAEPAALITGSANVSATSRDLRLEAFIATTDPGAVEAARQTIHGWIAEAGDPLDDAWQRRAAQLFRPPPQMPRYRQRTIPLSRQRLWLGVADPDDTGPTATVVAARESSRRDWSDATVDSWTLNPGDENLVACGDTLVLFTGNGTPGDPHGRARAWPPARIVALTDVGSNRPTAIYAYDPDLPSSTFARVRNAAAAQPDWQWDAPITNPQTINAVLKIFGR